ATGRGKNRVTEYRHFRKAGGTLGQFGHGLFDGQSLAVNHLVGATQRGDRLVGETPATHAFEVHAARFGRVAKYRNKRRYILADGRTHTGETVCADAAELMNQGKAGKNRPVVHP